MPQLLTQVCSSVPRKWPVIDRNPGRLHSGMVAAFKSEYPAGLNRNPQATPTCFGMPPALGVVLLDRSDPLWRDGQQLKGKLGAVIVNGATDPADDPSVRLCADNMIKFFEQHEMPCVQPVHLGGTLAYPEQRFPDPLPAGTTGVLEQLADEIRQWVGSR